MKRVQQKGWTLLELLLFGIVVVSALGAIIILLSGGSATTGAFTVKPATVQSGTPATFTYRVTKMQGGTPRGVLGRATSFAIAPAANGQIVSVTNEIGSIVAVNAATASSKTDSAGDISVVIQVDVVGPMTLTATDTRTSLTDTASFTGTP